MEQYKAVTTIPAFAVSRIDRLIRNMYSVWHYNFVVIPTLAPNYQEFLSLYARQMLNIWEYGWERLHGSPEQKRLHLLRLEQEAIDETMKRIRDDEQERRNARAGIIDLSIKS